MRTKLKLKTRLYARLLPRRSILPVDVLDSRMYYASTDTQALYISGHTGCTVTHASANAKIAHLHLRSLSPCARQNCCGRPRCCQANENTERLTTAQTQSLETELRPYKIFVKIRGRPRGVWDRVMHNCCQGA